MTPDLSHAMDRLRAMSAAWDDAAGALTVNDTQAFDQAMGRFRQLESKFDIQPRETGGSNKAPVSNS